MLFLILDGTKIFQNYIYNINAKEVERKKLAFYERVFKYIEHSKEKNKSTRLLIKIFKIVS